MEKFIPREKMSKKARRALDRSRRGTWGPQNPVTRTVENKKQYNRKKIRWKQDSTESFCAYRIWAAFILWADFSSLQSP